jgi:sporulation protein YlmC with PRC-barrel domain
MAAALLPLVAGLAGAVNPMVSGTNQPNQQDQQVAPSPTPSPGQAMGVQPRFDKAKDLIGAKVMNDKGEQLGTVADIVLTPGRDAVNYVVLSYGGTWGMGEKYFAVPWSQFGIQSGENGGKILVLKNVSKDDLDRAPGFDKNHWPTAASENWLGTSRATGRMETPSTGSTMRLIVNQNAGVAQNQNRNDSLFQAPKSGEYAEPDSFLPQPYIPPEPQTADRVQAADIEHLRLSKLLGTTIRNPQGEDLGKLDNAMIDEQQGKVAFGIVALRSGFLGLNKDYAAVPWSALNFTAQPGIARLDVDKQTLMASAFSRDSFPNFSDPQYSRELYQRFHVTPYWEGQNLGFIPGAEQNVNPPSSSGTAAPNIPTPSYIAHAEKHGMAWNPNAVETIHGTITSVGTYKHADTSMEGVLLHVKTDDGKTMRVYVGPRSFVDSHNVSFRKGDAVTITGSVAKTGHHETILASQIQTANRTLDLRTPDGKPLWNLEQSRSPSASRSSGGYQNTYVF